MPCAMTARRPVTVAVMGYRTKGFAPTPLPAHAAEGQYRQCAAGTGGQPSHLHPLPPVDRRCDAEARPHRHRQHRHQPVPDGDRSGRHQFPAPSSPRGGNLSGAGRSWRSGGRQRHGRHRRPLPGQGRRCLLLPRQRHRRVITARRIPNRAFSASGPGSPDCSPTRRYCRMAPRLKHAEFHGRIGTARTDVTPPVGIYSRTWGSAKHDVAEGVHRPALASCLVFQTLDGKSELVFLTMDSCCTDDHGCRRHPRRDPEALRPEAGTVDVPSVPFPQPAGPDPAHGRTARRRQADRLPGRVDRLLHRPDRAGARITWRKALSVGPMAAAGWPSTAMRWTRPRAATFAA